MGRNQGCPMPDMDGSGQLHSRPPVGQLSPAASLVAPLGKTHVREDKMLHGVRSKGKKHERKHHEDTKVRAEGGERMLQVLEQRSPAVPEEDHTRAGSGACGGDHGGAGRSMRRRSGEYGCLSPHGVRQLKNSSVGLERHLLFLADYCCKNFFRKTTKDLSVTCMVT